MAEALMTAVAALMVAGILVGVSLGSDTVNATTGLTWLGDAAAGEVVQVNPATGRPESRLAVAPPGHGLSLAQTETLLVVTDMATGEISVIDIATLTSGGSYRGSPETTRILLTESDLYVVDRARGTITRLDPGTARAFGTAWNAGRPLADAVIDGAGTIWALDDGGTLHQLTWAREMTKLVDASPARRIAGAGPTSLLVAHERGVTVVAPQSGRLIQVGTDHDGSIAAALGSEVAPAGFSPAAMVAVASPRDGTVTLLVDGADAVTVNVRGHGCRRPGSPVVHNGEAFVPCDGGRVVVLDRSGSVVRQIVVGSGGRPELTSDDGVLYICGHGGDCRYVDAQGVIHDLDTDGDDVPVRTPDPPATTPPPTTNPRRSTPGGTAGGTPGGTPGGGQGGTGTATQVVGPGTSTSAPPSTTTTTASPTHTFTRDPEPPCRRTPCPQIP